MNGELPMWSRAGMLKHLAALMRNVPDFPKPGVLFKDITPLLADSDALKMVVNLMSEPFADRGIDKVVGIESRGFIFGAAVARALNSGFVPLRKPGKLPAEVDSVSYELEYGTSTLEIHRDALTPGTRVLVVDDLLATGGTAVAAAQLIRRQGADIAGFAFVVELAFLDGVAAIKATGEADVCSLLKYGVGE